LDYVAVNNHKLDYVAVNKSVNYYKLVNYLDNSLDYKLEYN
jgi:hypothetical protein